MSNQQLIKSAHVWAVGLLLFGVIVFATKAGSNPTDLAQQNTNSNTNTNQNQNQNTNQNSNANTSNQNANVSGEQPATGTGALSSRDQKFMMNAAVAGLMEVQLGRWAAQTGTSEEVKQFGRRMIEHHSQANTELMQLASSKGVTLPTALDEKQQREVSKVSRLTGAEFDKAFSKKMLKDHENAVSDFEKQSTNGDDADLKAFAAKALPTLQEHLQMARALPANVGSSNSNANSNRNSNGNSNSNSP